MLLRRIIEHVRSQNWTAIGIDFVIVVVGVFIGIQAANWNEVRAEDARAREVLERLRDDLQSDLENFDQRMQFWQQVRDYGLSGLDYVDDPSPEAEEAWPAILAFFQASQVGEFFTNSGTFDELRSAGELSLVRDVGLRNALSGYYLEASNPSLTERPAYREHVRGRIPIDMQTYIWERCYESTVDAGQYLIDCPSPVSDDEAAAIALAIATDEELMGELRYWTSGMLVVRMIGQNRIDRAKNALALVEEAMAN